MNEGKENDDSGREFPERSDDEQVDPDVACEFISVAEDANYGQKSAALATTFVESVLTENDVGQTSELLEFKNDDDGPGFLDQMDIAIDHDGFSKARNEKENELGKLQVENGIEVKAEEVLTESNALVDASFKQESVGLECPVRKEGSTQSIFDPHSEGDDSGTEEEQATFMKELENFLRERSLEFKPPKSYGEGLNCLKTCTTISWSFQCFYEKALLEYEKHKIRSGELQVPISSLAEPMAVENQVGSNQASGSSRARRDAAARAMQGWHSQRLLGNGEIGDPIIKNKSSASIPKRNKQLKSIGVFKQEKASNLEHAVKSAWAKTANHKWIVWLLMLGHRLTG